VDFPLNPLAKQPYGNAFGFLVLESCRRGAVLREALRECAVLIGWLQARDFEGVRDAQFSRVEGLLDLVHEMDQTQPRIDVFFGPSDFLGKGLDGVGVGLQLHQGGVAPRFVENPGNITERRVLLMRCHSGVSRRRRRAMREGSTERHWLS
jgi:hypothetical protein